MFSKNSAFHQSDEVSEHLEGVRKHALDAARAHPLIAEKLDLEEVRQLIQEELQNSDD